MPGASSPNHPPPCPAWDAGVLSWTKCDEAVWGKGEAVKRIVGSKPGGQGWQSEPHNQCF